MAKKKKPRPGGGGPRSNSGGPASSGAPSVRAPSSRTPSPEEPKGASSSAPMGEPEEQIATDADASAKASTPPSERASDAGEVAASDVSRAPADEAPPQRHEHPLVGAPWARFLVTVDKYWTWFEWRFLFVVLASLIFLAVSWVALGGLAAPVPKDYETLGWFKRIKEAGGAFRALFGFAVLGGIARLATRKMPTRTRTLITAAAILAGILLAPVWRGSFVEYADNWKKWLQSGSSFTMFGGLRGSMSRTTILLAMLGASLAAASGKHIYIDVVQRFVKPGWRKLMFGLSTAMTIAVCFISAWGFLDYIAIESFGAKIEWNANQRTTHMLKEVSKDLFLWRKQVGLDLKAFPHVLAGGKWNDPERMNGAQWNEFLEAGGFRERYGDAVDELKAKDDQLDKPWAPQVFKPPHGQALNLLVHAMNLLFPFGLFMIGLRFLLRLILVLTDHQPVEAEAEEYAGAKSTAEELETRADAAMAGRKSDGGDDAKPDEEKPEGEDDAKPNEERSDGEDDAKPDEKKSDGEGDARSEEKKSDGDEKEEA